MTAAPSDPTPPWADDDRPSRGLRRATPRPPPSLHPQGGNPTSFGPSNSLRGGVMEVALLRTCPQCAPDPSVGFVHEVVSSPRPFLPPPSGTARRGARRRRQWTTMDERSYARIYGTFPLLPAYIYGTLKGRRECARGCSRGDSGAHFGRNSRCEPAPTAASAGTPCGSMPRGQASGRPFFFLVPSQSQTRPSGRPFVLSGSLPASTQTCKPAPLTGSSRHYYR